MTDTRAVPRAGAHGSAVVHMRDLIYSVSWNEWKTECSCEWKGEWQVGREQAERDHYEHATGRPAPREPHPTQCVSCGRPAPVGDSLSLSSWRVTADRAWCGTCMLADADARGYLTDAQLARFTQSNLG